MRNIEQLRIYESERERGIREKETAVRRKMKGGDSVTMRRVFEENTPAGSVESTEARCAARGTKAIVEANFKLSKPRFLRDAKG